MIHQRSMIHQSHRRILPVILVVLTVLSVISCAPSGSTRVTSAQKERIEIVEDELIRLSTDLIDLQTAYDYHLEDYHKIRPNQDSKYRVRYISDEVFQRANRPGSAKAKVKGLEEWTIYLFSFSKAFQKPYQKHVRFYHEVEPKVVEGEYLVPADTLSFEERIQALESNIVRLSNLVPRLEQLYDTHKETLLH